MTDDFDRELLGPEHNLHLTNILTPQNLEEIPHNLKQALAQVRRSYDGNPYAYGVLISDVRHSFARLGIKEDSPPELHRPFQLYDDYIKGQNDLQISNSFLCYLGHGTIFWGLIALAGAYALAGGGLTSEAGKYFQIPEFERGVATAVGALAASGLGLWGTGKTLNVIGRIGAPSEEEIQRLRNQNSERFKKSIEEYISS